MRQFRRIRLRLVNAFSQVVVVRCVIACGLVWVGFVFSLGGTMVDEWSDDENIQGQGQGPQQSQTALAHVHQVSPLHPSSATPRVPVGWPELQYFNTTHTTHTTRCLPFQISRIMLQLQTIHKESTGKKSDETCLLHLLLLLLARGFGKD